MGDAPVRPKFALKVTHPFEKRRLRQISAYNVSTVRDSEKSSIATNRKYMEHMIILMNTWTSHIRIHAPLFSFRLRVLVINSIHLNYYMPAVMAKNDGHINSLRSSTSSGVTVLAVFMVCCEFVVQFV